MNQPLPITVVIPAFNREHLLEATLASVKAQRRAPAEVIVVDDCSTDGTAAVAERHGARVIRHEHNQGAAAARNTGVAAATQEWIALLDSDDEWTASHLEVVWGGRDGCDFVATSALHHRGGSRRVSGTPRWHPLRLRSPAQLLYPENVVPLSAALVRRAAFEAVGRNDTMWRHSEDFDLWLRLLTVGTGRVLPEVTCLYGDHPDQKSRQRAKAGAAQYGIAQRIAQDHRVDVALVERRRGVRLWDDLRLALATGDREAAVRHARAIASHPQRPVGIVGIWLWRRLLARRARSVDEHGRQRVAVLAGEPRPANAHEVVVDLTHLPARERWAELLRRPPRYALGAQGMDRVVCRVAGVEAR